MNDVEVKSLFAVRTVAEAGVESIRLIIRRISKADRVVAHFQQFAEVFNGNVQLSVKVKSKVRGVSEMQADSTGIQEQSSCGAEDLTAKV